MWAFLLKFVTGDLASLLLKWRETELNAKTSEQKEIAQAAIKDIERQIEQGRAAKEIRLATAGFWEVRLITAIIAGSFAFHLLLVTLDTCFRFGWGIPKMPAPFDAYQGTVLLSFFGVQVIGQGITTLASAIRGRR